MPFSPVFRNVLQVGILGQARGCSLGAPTRYAREPVRTVTYNGKIIRYGLWFYSKFADNLRFAEHDVPPPVQLNNACSHNTLTEIFVWRANQNSGHTHILGCFCCRRSERIV